mmetsp:Transcript_17579/g.52804  ORF Transcript_17579/g.52804 Transcript_17579/m.52804 type:complete len:337 (+) Transcript_17579:1126-2136(+)
MDRHAAAASSASGAVVLIKLEPPNTSAGRSASESGSPDPAVELIDDSSDADLVTVWDATSPAIGAAMPVSVSAAAPFTLAVARERAHDANDALLTSDIRGGRAAAIAAAEGGAGGAGGAHSGGRSQKVKPVFTVGVYPWWCRWRRVRAPHSSATACTTSGLGTTASGSHRWSIGLTPALRPASNLMPQTRSIREMKLMQAVRCGAGSCPGGRQKIAPATKSNMLSRRMLSRGAPWNQPERKSPMSITPCRRKKASMACSEASMLGGCAPSSLHAGNRNDCKAWKLNSAAAVPANRRFTNPRFLAGAAVRPGAAMSHPRAPLRTPIEGPVTAARFAL